MTRDPLAYECLSALIGQTGEKGPVCEGYARAFKVLCDAVGIQCVLTDGITSSNEPHMWNYVEVGGKWYGVDVTWNDPPNIDEEAVSGLENESYMLVGANTISSATSNGSTFLDTHTVENNHFENGLYYINGPLLSNTAFVFDTGLSFSNALEDIDLGYSQISGLRDAVFNKHPIIQQNMKVSLKGINLQHGNDYIYDCNNNVNPGQATVKVYGRGNYCGSASSAFTIKSAEIKVEDVSIASVTYTGNPLKPKPKITLANTRLVEGEDYSVVTTYTNNVNAGTAKVKVVIRGLNSCTGVVEKNFTFAIKKAALGDATISTNDVTYTGNVLTPKVMVAMSNPRLAKGKDYSVAFSYSNNKNAGLATVTATIKGMGNYAGTLTRSANFVIAPKQMKLVKLLSKKKSFVANWSKAAKAWCSGYQIRYSTNSKMKTGVKTVTISKYSKGQAKVSRLAKKKNYYVQIRAYKAVGGAKYYGDWSSAKKVRTK